MTRRISAGLTLIFAGSMLGSCSKKPDYNVVLLTFDTTRADFIGAYGRETATTPTLDDLAARGYLFERARTSNPITQPAHSTILTGMYPLMHGVRDNGLFHLPDELDTLAERLQRVGYRTGAAIGGFPLTREFGTDQGFDFYDDDLRATKQDHRGRPAPAQNNTWYDERPAPHVNDAILRFLRQPSDDPFFVWLHYWDPHEPHIAPPPFGQLYAHDPYQGEIAYADQALGSLLSRLEAMGELEKTIVIMTSDHGEGRREHNEMTHAFLAYETTLHVPLIMYVPDMPGGRRITENVGTVDIVPTVLDLLGMEVPEELQGRSLKEVMAADSEQEAMVNELYYAESMSPRLSHGIGDLRVVYDGPNKLIYGPRPELFDLFSDPHERNDIIEQEPQLAQELQQSLAGLLEWYAGDLSASHEFDPETIERLAGLGYLNMTGGDATVTEELRTDGEAPQDQVGDINKVFMLRRLLSSGNLQRAAELAAELLERAPGQGYLQSQLALAHALLEDFDAAVAVIDQAETINVGNINAFAQVARAWFDAGEQEPALALMQRLIASEQTHVALLHKAHMERELDQVDAGISSLEQAIEANPDAPEPKIELAFWLLDLDRAASAEPVLHDLIASHPALARAHQGLGRVYWMSDHREQALDRLERALLLNPLDCDALELKIAWLTELERTDAVASAIAEAPPVCRDAVTAQTAP